MAFTLTKLDSSHTFQISDVGARAFAADPLTLRSRLPGFDADQLHEARLERTRRYLASTDPTQRFIVAVDDNSGKVLGFARWRAPAAGSARPAESAIDGLKDVKGFDMPFLDMVKGMLDAAVLEYMGEGSDYWYLASLAVDPAAQGRGIATALIEWATAQADAASERCYVESSIPAVGVYTRSGFQELKWLDFGDGARRLCMVREPR